MAKPVYKNLTFQVLTAILIGLTIGYLRPAWGVAMEPLGLGFIRLVKMVVGPIIFLTVSVGIASMGDLKKVGRVGVKALLYFEVVTTLALAIGLLVANVAKPGAGATHQTTVANVRVTELQAEAQQKHSFVDFFLHVIPENVIDSFAKGDLLQIVFFSVLFGLALASLGTAIDRLTDALEQLTGVMFRIVSLIMKVAPLGAMGAMAFTIGKYGIGSLLSLAKLMACVYLTMALFIFVVLAIICRFSGFSLFRYLAFIKEEILLVLGTSTSESALPRIIEKLELLGCSRGVVGMLVPAGYSFNLDGTSIYLSMAALFIAQAYGVHLSVGQQLYIMGILMVTSKGAAAVSGGGIITLTSTIMATHMLPIEGIALLLGVDRFMSEARAITNLIGNGVATIVVSKWEGEFDEARYHAAIYGKPVAGGFPIELTADLARERSGASIRI